MPVGQHLNAAAQVSDSLYAAVLSGFTAFHLHGLSCTCLKPSFTSSLVTPTLVLAVGAGYRERPAVIVNMSARVGSITDNRLGGWYSYRASKAALNQLTKTMSIEIARKKQNVACILLHPGTCDTDLSKPFQKVRTCRLQLGPTASESVCGVRLWMQKQIYDLSFLSHGILGKPV